MSYALRLHSRAQRGLDELSARDSDAIVRVIQSLRENPWPRGTRKLRSRAPAWRIRVRDYRVIDAVFDQDQLVVVLAIERRSEQTYQDINGLFR